MKAQNLNRKQAYWALYLSRFNFILKYVPGIKMGKTNRLIRQLDYEVGTKNDNSNQTLIKDQWVHNLVEVVIEESEVDIVEKIKRAREKDKKVVRVVEVIKKMGVEVLWRDE